MSALGTHAVLGFSPVFVSREETEPQSAAPEAPIENTVRPRKRKADVAIVSNVGVQRAGRRAWSRPPPCFSFGCSCTNRPALNDPNINLVLYIETLAYCLLKYY